MKIAVLIARILLGLVFLMFGLNAFFHFIPMQPDSGRRGSTGRAAVRAWMVFVPRDSVCDRRSTTAGWDGMFRWRW